MPAANTLLLWLVYSAIAGSLFLVIGCLAVRWRRQPVERLRLIEWTLLACLFAPLVNHLPGLPRWSLGWLTPTAEETVEETVASAPSNTDNSVPQPSTAEEPAESTPTNIDNSDAQPSTSEPERSFGDASLVVSKLIRLAQQKSNSRKLSPQSSLATASVHPSTSSADHPTANPSPLPHGKSASTPWPWSQVLVTAYLLGVAILGAWYFFGFVILVWLDRTAQPVPDVVATLFRSLVSGPASRKVRLCMNRRVELPLAYGLWRPTILLPEEMCVVGTELGLRYSLLHEWSHVSRRDIRRWRLSTLVGILFFYQPLFWWLRQQLRVCQDYLADSLAAGPTDAREDYAQFLLHLAQRRFGLSAKVALSIGGGRSNLYSRVLMLLNARQPLAQQLRWTRKLAIAAVAIVLIGLTSIVQLEANLALPAIRPVPPAAATTEAKADAKPVAPPETKSTEEAEPKIVWPSKPKTVAQVERERLPLALIDVRLHEIEANKLADQGRFAEAIKLVQPGVAIKKEVLGEKNPSYAQSLTILANLYEHVGDYANAEPLFVQASAIFKEKNTEYDPAYINSILNLAALYRQKRDYAKAESLVLRSQAILKEVGGEKDFNYAWSLTELGELYSRKDIAKGEPLILEALAILKELPGKEKNPFYAATLEHLAIVYEMFGREAEAVSLRLQSLEITKEAYGEKHRNYAFILHNLAHLYQKMGEYQKAEPLYQQAIAIQKEVMGENNLVYEIGIRHLAMLYQDMGDYQKAEPLFRQASAIIKEVQGEKYPDYATSLSSLAWCYAGMANWPQATASMERASRAFNSYERQALTGRSAKEQSAFLKATDALTYHTALSLGLLRRTADAKTVELSYGWLVNEKHLAPAAVAESARLALERAADSELADTIKALIDFRRQLVSLVLGTPESGQDQPRRAKFEQFGISENELATRITQVAGEAIQAVKWIEPAAVRKEIPGDGILVDIVRFNARNLGAKSTDQKSQPAHYAVWLVPPTDKGEIKIIDLGEADKIDAAVKAIRTALTSAVQEKHTAEEQKAPLDAQSQESLLKQPLAELAKLVLQPVLTEIPAGTKQLIVSPRSMLWLVPWETLPMQDGRNAIEAYQIRYLLSGRDLVTK